METGDDLQVYEMSQVQGMLLNIRLIPNVSWENVESVTRIPVMQTIPQCERASERERDI